jgi:hypothetical protein
MVVFPDGHPPAYPPTALGESLAELDAPELSPSMDRQELEKRLADIQTNHRVEREPTVARLVKFTVS